MGFSVGREGQDMAFCDKCANKKVCGPRCTGFVPKGRFYIEGRKPQVRMELWGNMREIEEIETRHRRELRKPIDYAE